MLLKNAVAPKMVLARSYNMAKQPAPREVLLLGVDGGGTCCRARLCSPDGKILGHGVAGAGNIRFGMAAGFAAVHLATEGCFRQAGLDRHAVNIIACLALAGASEPGLLAQARAQPNPFFRTVVTTDAQAACVGAHSGADGGIIIVGTGSIGWARVGGRELRVGGWGFPLSDEGSGAWLGFAALQRVQRAFDGLIDWTDLLGAIFNHFDRDPHRIVSWMHTALPRDYAALAPLVVAHAREGDPLARDLMREAAASVERMIERLRDQQVDKMSLMGGLAEHIEPYLSLSTRQTLDPPEGDALSGAVLLAHREWLAMQHSPRSIENA